MRVYWYLSSSSLSVRRIKREMGGAGSRAKRTLTALDLNPAAVLYRDVRLRLRLLRLREDCRHRRRYGLKFASTCTPTPRAHGPT